MVVELRTCSQTREQHDQGKRLVPTRVARAQQSGREAGIHEGFERFSGAKVVTADCMLAGAQVAADNVGGRRARHRLPR